jgi:ABC-2 type transport system permease protein
MNMVNVIYEIAKKETISFYSNRGNLIRNGILLLVFCYLPINQMGYILGSNGHTANAVVTLLLGQSSNTANSVFSALDILLLFGAFYPVLISSQMAVMAFPVERDQRTLEHLLSLPLSDGEIFLGKFLSAVVTGLVGLAFVFTVVIGYTLANSGLAWNDILLNDTLGLLIFVITPLMVILVTLLTVVLSSHISSPRDAYIINLMIMVVMMAMNAAIASVSADTLIFNSGLAVFFAVATVILYVMGIKSVSREKLISNI